MRNALFATTCAAALVVGFAPAAAAHPAYDYAGGCGFTAASDGGEGPGTVWTGEAHAVVVATDAAGTPAPATPIAVECVAYVNHADPATLLTASGTGVAGGATTWSYQAATDDVVTLCEIVVVGGERHESCGDGGPLVPEEVDDLIQKIYDLLIWGPGPDLTICWAIASAAPGVPGVVDVTPEGDVYLAGEHFWDCPPYAG